MTEDTLDKAESALAAIKNLGLLLNNIESCLQTTGRMTPDMPGIDDLIRRASQFGILTPADIQPFLISLEEKVKAKQDELQKEFDAL